MSTIREFDPFRVRPLPDQPRKRFRGIAELAASIAEVGQAVPGIVTLVDDCSDFDAQLVDGERRLRACRNLGKKFRAEVTVTAEAFTSSFAANFGKQDHDCMEIAEGLEKLKEAGKSIGQMAAIAGKSEAWVRQHLSFNTLHPAVKEMMIPGPDGEKPPVNFQLALLLVPLPQGRQPSLAMKISKDIGLKAAERLILNERREAGDRSHGARRSIYTLENHLETFGHVLGVYLDMPAAELNHSIDCGCPKSKRDLMAAFTDAIEALTGLREAVEARLPKLARRKAS